MDVTLALVEELAWLNDNCGVPAGRKYENYEKKRKKEKSQSRGIVLSSHLFRAHTCEMFHFCSRTSRDSDSSNMCLAASRWPWLTVGSRNGRRVALRPLPGPPATFTAPVRINFNSYSFFFFPDRSFESLWTVMEFLFFFNPLSYDFFC